MQFYSQDGQDEFIVNLFKHKKEWIFFRRGACDGSITAIHFIWKRTCPGKEFVLNQTHWLLISLTRTGIQSISIVALVIRKTPTNFFLFQSMRSCLAA